MWSVREFKGNFLLITLQRYRTYGAQWYIFIVSILVRRSETLVANRICDKNISPDVRRGRPETG